MDAARGNESASRNALLFPLFFSKPNINPNPEHQTNFSIILP
jgi:hypothetical protein